jgi:iron complex outermembrane recepter protein
MRTIIYLSCIILLLPLYLIKPQDSVRTYYLSPVEIIAKKEINLLDNHKYGTDYNSDLFDRNGLSMVRRGAGFTQDIYSEGFKRGDVKIVIDGEHYHTACPNRMDAPAIRVNPLEMQSVDLTKSAGLLSTGIYGKIEYHRADLEEQRRLKTFLTGNTGAQNDFDAAVSLDGYKTNAVFRVSRGTPYKTADGKKFSELYGYKDNFHYTFGSAGIRHQSGNIHLGTSFTYGENISFPYLQMDEMHSKVFSAFVGFKGHKAYFNYTDHLMNNTLRLSPMFMETDAKNYTLGITGNFYEIVYRYWNADNIIKNPMMNIDIANKLMPEVNQLSAAGSKDIHLFGNFSLVVKGGLQYFRVGDESRMEFYKTLYPDAEETRIYLSAGLNFNYTHQFAKDVVLFLSAEGAAESPEAEQLYIAVQRPMTNPDWAGNPTLKQPLKASLRAAIDYKFIRLEGYANYVTNYVNVVKRQAMKSHLTYDNIDAALLGINASAVLPYFETYISSLYGENTTNSSPLAEITPLAVKSKLNLPDIFDLKVFFTHKYENVQKRIDIELNELASAAWNSFGAGVRYRYANLSFDFEVENLLNHNYSRHLSYTRSPFASGVKVYDPGRTFRLTLYYDSIF